MTQSHGELRVSTHGKGLYEITRDVARWLDQQNIRDGLLTVFIRHTSASLIIQENADPDVRRDLAEFFERLVPENTPWFRHTTEGSDDMPSHIRSALTSPQLAIPVRGGRMALGTWQGIYVFEHRSEPQLRQVVTHIIGDS
jgi:secondary thiamine-phosphate synthase enzyme